MQLKLHRQIQNLNNKSTEYVLCEIANPYMNLKLPKQNTIKISHIFFSNPNLKLSMNECSLK